MMAVEMTYFLCVVESSKRLLSWLRGGVEVVLWKKEEKGEEWRARWGFKAFRKRKREWARLALKWGDFKE